MNAAAIPGAPGSLEWFAEMFHGRTPHPPAREPEPFALVISDRQTGKTSALVALAVTDPDVVIVTVDERARRRTVDALAHAYPRRDHQAPMLGQARRQVTTIDRCYEETRGRGGRTRYVFDEIGGLIQRLLARAITAPPDAVIAATMSPPWIPQTDNVDEPPERRPGTGRRLFPGQT